MSSSSDKEIFSLIEQEKIRQKEGLELIPSENYTSADVMKACGSILTNKYSEGYPGRRYYGGQEYIDKIETIAKQRALKLFKLDSDKWHANVQSYSGSPANMAVYFALLNPGDKIMGMDLMFGGHLTHGWKVNFSAKYYKSVQYTVGKDGRIDYEDLRKMAKKERPKIIVAGATAYPRKLDFKKFSQIAKEVDAYFLADIAHVAGLIIAGVHPSPFPYADVVSTTTHKTLRGPRSAMIICKKELADAIDRAVFPGLQGGPHDHINAAKAVAFKEASGPGFIRYGQQIVKNAKVLAEELKKHGFDLVTGGTDNHLLLIDLTNKGIPGKVAEEVLDKIGITLNKNTVPYEKRSPFDPSGIRLGTPALTTRNMKEKEMILVAKYINEALSLIVVDDEKIKSKGSWPKFKTTYTYDKKKLNEVHGKVVKLALKFPISGIGDDE